MPKNASKTDIAIERFGKAIGNRTRVQILQSLAAGPKSVKTLVETVGAISQPAVSQDRRACLGQAWRPGSALFIQSETIPRYAACAGVLDWCTETVKLPILMAVR